MNKRQLDIIDELKYRTHTLETLAEKYEVSQRTIRNDINKINDWLYEQKSEPLQLQSGGRIAVPGDYSDSAVFEVEDDYYNYKLSKEERRRIASILLINSPGYITLGAIAEAVYVSRATIIGDLPDIKEFISEGGLQVHSHANKGLRVEGKESDKRKFLFQLSAFEKREQEGGVTAVNIEAGSKITIRKIISEQEQVHRLFLSDSSFLKIQKYIGIMLSRNLQGEYLEPQPAGEGEKFLFAQDIMKYIAQYFGIRTTVDEISWLSTMLSSCRYIKKQEFDIASVQIQMLTRQFIHRVSERLGNSLENDYEFFESLSNHMESMLASTAAEFPDNEALKEIIEDNEAVRSAVLAEVSEIEQYAGRSFSENEIMYIAIHVCAALERKKNREIAFHVVISCHAGIGTSQLLMERLKKHFNFQIVDIVSSHEAVTVTPEKADLIISTVPLTGCSVDHIVVSPILTDEDYIRVGSKIDALRNSRNLPSRTETEELSATGLIERLQPIVYDSLPDEEARVLMKQLKREIRRYFNQSREAEEEIFAPALHHLLTPESIQLDVACEDWKSAIRASALPMLQAHMIEERYIDAMIRNVEENGPYIVLSPGFAVPHEGLEMGSVQVGMNLIRLKEPVFFGEEEQEPVEFVCCLSAVDHKTHLRALFNLVNMLSQTELKEALRQVRTPEEAARVIERYEYSLDQ
ncbi:MAG: BglG family transcription antiterminator [Lachnospiraceae bacterium]|nr:BglG family transcription antiterminator [Lachnospiraceae bacterium]